MKTTKDLIQAKGVSGEAKLLGLFVIAAGPCRVNILDASEGMNTRRGDTERAFRQLARIGINTSTEPTELLFEHGNPWTEADLSEVPVQISQLSPPEPDEPPPPADEGDDPKTEDMKPPKKGAKKSSKKGAK